MVEYGLGRIAAPDSRDRLHLMAAVLIPAAPRPAFRYYASGGVLDQGPTSSCVGHAWRAWMSAAPVMTKAGPDAFKIYDEAKFVDEWPGEDYDGTSVRGGAKVLYTAGYIASYVWAWDAETVADFILSGQGTVVMGTEWTYAMFEPDAKGFLHPTGPIAGGHAWLLVGYSRTRGVFRMQNSWGREWSQNGRAWITGEDLQTLIRWDGEAAAAVEQRSV
jgi:hypothetical protein